MKLWSGTDRIDGKERTFYSVRLIALCGTIAAAVAALVCIVVVVTVTGNQNASNYKQALDFCDRQNDIRRESNLRIPEHKADADNLRKLAATLARTRRREAAFFEGIVKQNPDPEMRAKAQKAVEPLIALYRRAEALDAKIADEQELVRFSGLRIFDCTDPRIVRP